jgi:hypothetical protein
MTDGVFDVTVKRAPRNLPRVLVLVTFELFTFRDDLGQNDVEMCYLRPRPNLVRKAGSIPRPPLHTGDTFIHEKAQIKRKKKRWNTVIRDSVHNKYERICINKYDDK